MLFKIHKKITNNSYIDGISMYVSYNDYNLINIGEMGVRFIELYVDVSMDNKNYHLIIDGIDLI